MWTCTPELGGRLPETQCFLPLRCCVLALLWIKYFLRKSIYSYEGRQGQEEKVCLHLPAAHSSRSGDLAFRYTISEGDFPRKPSMTHTKQTKEKGICDCESQSPPKSTLIHTNGPSKQLASPSRNPILQRQAHFFSNLFTCGLAHPHTASLPLLGCLHPPILPLVFAGLNHKQSSPRSK